MCSFIMIIGICSLVELLFFVVINLYKETHCSTYGELNILSAWHDMGEIVIVYPGLLMKSCWMMNLLLWCWILLHWVIPCFCLVFSLLHQRYMD